VDAGTCTRYDGRCSSWLNNKHPNTSSESVDYVSRADWASAQEQEARWSARVPAPASRTSQVVRTHDMSTGRPDTYQAEVVLQFVCMYAACMYVCAACMHVCMHVRMYV
jgi:hypothetical protein